MNQRSLFDDPRVLARSGDPVTSHEAAAYTVGTGLRAKQQQRVLDMIRQTPGLTARELAARHGVDDIRDINRRLPELEQQGLARPGEPRRDRASASGRRARPWYPT